MNICMQGQVLRQAVTSFPIHCSIPAIPLSSLSSNSVFPSPFPLFPIPSQAKADASLSATAKALSSHLSHSSHLFNQSLRAFLAAAKSAFSKPGTVHHLWHDRINGCAGHMAAWLQAVKRYKELGREEVLGELIVGKGQALRMPFRPWKCYKHGH